MQRILSNANATINALADKQIGLANVAAEAGMRTASTAGSTCSGPSSSSSVRGHVRPRHDDHGEQWPGGTYFGGPDMPVVGGEKPMQAGLPPRLWAAWVLSRSLCG